MNYYIKWQTDTLNGESRGTAGLPTFENKWEVISSRKEIDCLPL